MKKLAFISILLLLTLPSLGQVRLKIDTTITGLWEFSFGMSPTEVEQAMSRYQTERTNLIHESAEDSTIIFTNIVYDNILFDHSNFRFEDDELKEITFVKYVIPGLDKPDIVDQYIDLKTMFDEEYGDQIEVPEMEDNTMYYTWYDNNRTTLIVSMLLNNRPAIAVSAKLKKDAIKQEKKELIADDLISEYLTEVAITGIGKLELDMSSDEFKSALDQYVTPSTKISGTFDGESTISATNLKILGYTFNECSFDFTDNLLKRIFLFMYFDKKNQNPKEFDELLSTFERRHGNRTRDEDNTYIWENKDQRLIMLWKTQNKERIEINLMIRTNIQEEMNMKGY